ncbi:outer membrane lipoprotein-sorting protein [Limimaricola variabilis]|jgi:outer membrane lipoprotein-sorting protein|uniref:Outer membrane lipoprotein-sorting protein n=1 Tax=Limimaricola variabilis TaxID=1492771 RepID=A0ABR6HKU2_9RHOB|nr:outer membrane lipoprotein carrier protein LolA [Limimaricola variabilis]MBB3711154.1 outer membrane lipoprotein-sorting protein [Limimaricola variabilis]WPY93860.1 outer membrane lipoprotein carrier protein LolA [Limimaricola variabilis]
MTMIRRSFLASLAAASLAVAAGPAFARQLSLGEISNYLNQLQSASSGFTQINGDGSIQTGTMYIKRPGRIRFEYQGDRSMMIAGGGQVAVFDARSNTGPERYPLNQTPLNIILERNVDLGRAGMVTGHTSDGTKTTVTAQDPAHPEYGSIQMVFTADPVELRQWIVTDDAGQKTTVVLNDLRPGASISDSKFNIRSEMSKW